MRFAGTILALIFAACSGSTGPKGLDPTVLIANPVGTVPLVMTWFDQSGQVSTATVPIGQQQCVHFIATKLADSVRFVAYMGDTLAGNTALWTRQVSPWFNPLNGIPSNGIVTGYPNGAEYWSLTSDGPVDFLMKPVATAPC